MFEDSTLKQKNYELQVVNKTFVYIPNNFVLVKKL